MIKFVHNQLFEANVINHQRIFLIFKALRFFGILLLHLRKLTIL